MWKLLSGAAGKKPIIDDMQIYLAELQYVTLNELSTFSFTTDAKNYRYLTSSNARPG